MKRYIYGALLLVLFGLPDFLCAAAVPVGNFTFIKGRVDITTPGEAARPASIGAAVYEGDFVRTKSGAKAEIKFVDDSILRLAQNSRVEVRDYQVKEKERFSRLNLWRGKIQSIVKRFAGIAFGRRQANRYEVHTPTAVCGVRGTDFVSTFMNGVSNFAFKEGEGYGYNINQPDQIVDINPGQMMTVRSETAAPQITDYTAEQAGADAPELTPDEGGTEDTESEPEGPPAGAEALTTMLEALPEETAAAVESAVKKVVQETQLDFNLDDIDPDSDERLSIVTGEDGLPEDILETQFSNVSIGLGEGDTVTLSGVVSGSAPFPYAASLPAGLLETPAGGSAEGFLGGVAGTWNGLISALYVENDGALGYLTSTDLVDETGPSAAGEISATGSYCRMQIDTTELLPRDLAGSMTSFPFPLPVILSEGGATLTSVRALELSDPGHYAGVWGAATLDGVYSNNADGSALPYFEGQIGLAGSFSLMNNRTDNYFIVGRFSGEDDLAGHVRIDDGQFTYLDGSYLGDIIFDTRGTYVPPETHSGIYTEASSRQILSESGPLHYGAPIESAPFGAATVGRLMLTPLKFRGGIAGTVSRSGTEGTVGSVSGAFGGTGYLESSSEFVALGQYSGAQPGDQWSGTLGGSANAGDGGLIYFFGEVAGAFGTGGAFTMEPCCPGVRYLVPAGGNRFQSGNLLISSSDDAGYFEDLQFWGDTYGSVSLEAGSPLAFGGGISGRFDNGSAILQGYAGSASIDLADFFAVGDFSAVPQGSWRGQLAGVGADSTGPPVYLIGDLNSGTLLNDQLGAGFSGYKLDVYGIKQTAGDFTAGIYQNVWYAGPLSESNDQILAEFDISGAWGGSAFSPTGTLFYDDGGYKGVAAHDYGLFGLSETAPAETRSGEALYALFAMGEFSYGHNGEGPGTIESPLLWDSAVRNQGDFSAFPYAGLSAQDFVGTGSFNGYTVGLWKTDPSKSLDGAGVGLWVDADQTTAMLLSSLAQDQRLTQGSEFGQYGVTGKYYSTIPGFDGGMWLAAGELAALNTISLDIGYPKPLSGFSNVQLAGDFNGQGKIHGIGSALTTLYYSGAADTIGTYTIGFGDLDGGSIPTSEFSTGSDYGNIYVGGPGTWSAKVGGQFFEYSGGADSEIYYLAEAAGGFNSDDGTITGYIGGEPGAAVGQEDFLNAYMTLYDAGTLHGPVYGLYSPSTDGGSDNTWVAQSAGVLQGQKLTHVSRLESEVEYATQKTIGTYTYGDGSTSTYEYNPVNQTGSLVYQSQTDDYYKEILPDGSWYGYNSTLQQSIQGQIPAGVSLLSYLQTPLSADGSYETHTEDTEFSILSSSYLHGLWGGTQTLWPQTDPGTPTASEIFSLGSFYDYYGSSSYDYASSVWYDELVSHNFLTQQDTLYPHEISTGVTAEGAYYAYTGGIRLDDRLDGKIVGLYMLGEAGGYTGGLIYSDDLAGKIYPEVSMYQMTGTVQWEAFDEIAGHQVEPEAFFTQGLQKGTGYAGLSGGFGSGSTPLSTASAVDDAAILSMPYEGGFQTASLVGTPKSQDMAQTWGIYRHELFGTYSGGSGQWTAALGGTAEFGVYYEDGNYYVDEGGYFIGTIAPHEYIAPHENNDGLTVTPDWQNREISALYSGEFLTPYKMGDIDGFVTGTYNDAVGTWEMIHIGAWDGYWLSLSGNLQSALKHFNDTPWTGNPPALCETVWVDALVGSLENDFSNTSEGIRLTLMGGMDQDLTETPLLLYGSGATIEASPPPGAESAAGDAVVKGFVTGVWHDRDITAKSVGLYVSEAGGVNEAGYLLPSEGFNVDNGVGPNYEPMTAAYYPDLMIWKAESEMTPQYVSNTAFSPADVRLGTCDGCALVGDYFRGANEIGPGPQDDFQVSVSVAEGDSLRISDQPWGIWNAAMAGHYSGTPTDNWHVAMGGWFSETESWDLAFWTGAVEGSAWDSDVIQGAYTGEALSESYLYTFSGDVWGTAMDDGGFGTWQTAGIGTFDRQALGFYAYLTDPDSSLSEIYGNLGGTGSLMSTEGAAVTLMGSSASNAPLWPVLFESRNGGDVSFVGFLNLNAGGGHDLRGHAVGIYADSSGDAGYLLSGVDDGAGGIQATPLNGMFYPGENTWAAGTNYGSGGAKLWRLDQPDNGAYSTLDSLQIDEMEDIATVTFLDTASNNTWNSDIGLETRAIPEEPWGIFRCAAGGVELIQAGDLELENEYWLSIGSGTFAYNADFEEDEYSGYATGYYINRSAMLAKRFDADIDFDPETLEWTIASVSEENIPLDSVLFWNPEKDGTGNTCLYSNGQLAGYDWGLLGLTSEPDENSFLALGDYEIDETFDDKPLLWRSVIEQYDGSLETVGFSGGLWDEDIMSGGVLLLSRSSTEGPGISTGLLSGRWLETFEVYDDNGEVLWGYGGYWTAAGHLGFVPLPGTLNDDTVAFDSLSLANAGGGSDNFVVVQDQGQWAHYADLPAWGVWHTLLNGTLESVPTSGDVKMALLGGSTANEAWISLSGEPHYSMDGYEVFEGEASGAWVSLSDTLSGVMGGDLIGTFDPSTWQGIAGGAFLETSEFLKRVAVKMDENGDPVLDQEGNFVLSETHRIHDLQQLNIPFAVVGMTDFTGGDSVLTSVRMDDVTFFSRSTGPDPKIWATDKVHGTFAEAPGTGHTVVLNSTGGGLTADFTVRQWNDAAWGAAVQGGGTYSGPGPMKGNTIWMQGGAAGQIGVNAAGEAVSDAFSGTGAGVAGPGINPYAGGQP